MNTPRPASRGLRKYQLWRSFFDSVPAGGDCYLLKLVIYDWDEKLSVASIVSLPPSTE